MKRIPLFFTVLLMILAITSCDKKAPENTENVSLSKGEILSLLGIEEKEIVFSKVELDLSGKPLLTIAAYDKESRELFSRDFSQREIKGGYITVAVLKSPVINALRFLYAITDRNGVQEAYVQDLPYYQYQQVEIEKAQFSKITSKGEFKILTASFGQNQQNIYLKVK